MNRSRIALSLLMIVYAMSLLAVGQANDQGQRRDRRPVADEGNKPAAGSSSGTDFTADSFTYYGPEDAATVKALDDDYPFGPDAVPAIDDEFRLPVQVDEPVELPAADDELGLEPVVGNDDPPPAPPANTVAIEPEVPVNVDLDSTLTVDSVLFDSLGQDIDSDAAFYAQHADEVDGLQSKESTDELRIPAHCPPTQGCTFGIRCPLFDHCRELMNDALDTLPTFEIEQQSLPVAKSRPQDTDFDTEGVYHAEFGAAHRKGYDCGEVAPKSHNYLYPETFGLDCDEYVGCPLPPRNRTPAASIEDCWLHDYDYFDCECHRGWMPNTTAPASHDLQNMFADDESMWDCHLADPTYVPAKSPPSLPLPVAVEYQPRATSTSALLDMNADLSSLWTVSLIDVLANDDHSEGHDLAWYINIENDGLTRTPRVVSQGHAVALVRMVMEGLEAIADTIAGQIRDARHQWYADYGYSWDEEAFPARGEYRDLNLELEF